MKQSITIVTAVNVLLAVLVIVLKRLQFRDAGVSMYGVASALAIYGFLLTWAYVAVALLVMWLIGEAVRGALLYLWTVTAGVLVIWYLVGLVRFLFP